MRRVWPIPPCPQRLAESGSPGAEERERAIAHFTGPDASSEGFPFSAYSHDEVRDALHSGFYWVCAYCERQVASIEIEHYRPKGTVKTVDGELPGYYWLAATWENLLPSCHDCNTRLRTWSPSGDRSVSGKGTWFPLENEAMRARAVGEEIRERPLLLHPYYDDPSDHLEFIDEGVIRAKRSDGGGSSRRGEVTIDLLGLNRHGLPAARHQRQILLEATFYAMREAEAEFRDAPDDSHLADEYQRHLDELEAQLHPQAGFSELAKQALERIIDDGALLPRGGAVG